MLASTTVSQYKHELWREMGKRLPWEHRRSMDDRRSARGPSNGGMGSVAMVGCAKKGRRGGVMLIEGGVPALRDRVG